MTRRFDNGEVALLADARCAACAGTCLWRRLENQSVRMGDGGLGLACGDRVEIRIPESHALLGAAIVYGLPLAGLLAGAAVAAWVDRGDLAVLAGAVAGCTLAYGTTATWRRRVERAVAARFDIRRIAGDSC